MRSTTAIEGTSHAAVGSWQSCFAKDKGLDMKGECLVGRASASCSLCFFLVARYFFVLHDRLQVSEKAVGLGVGKDGAEGS